MRLKIREGAVGESTGGRVTGPLHLFRDPLLPLEGVTKRYVDAIPNNLSASLITSGTLRNNMLPAWNGEVTTTAGGRVITIKNTVAANTYQSVNVNTKGLVVGGGPLVVSDIPNLNWSKVSKGRPNSLAGYGINDGINLTGGSLTGSLVLSRNPVLNNEVATKKYSDDIGMLTSLNTGDVIRKLTSVTPIGFLKCNGAILDKTMYSDLYSVLGNKFNVYITPGNGKPWNRQYGFNSTNDELGPWISENNLIGSISMTQAIVTKNRVYLLGGHAGDRSGVISTVYTAPITEEGDIGEWVIGNPLPSGIGYSQAIVTKNRVYLLGGYNGRALSTTHTALILEDGTIGEWSRGEDLVASLHYSSVTVIKNRVYIMGGYGYKDFYTATIDEDGFINNWVKLPDLPFATYSSNIIVLGNKLYVLGGVALSAVYSNIIDDDGLLGTWSSENPLPMTNPSSAQVITTRTKVYLLTTGSNLVYSSVIKEDNSIGPWELSNETLPGSVYRSEVIVTKNKIYILGGSSNGSNNINFVYSTRFKGGRNDYSSFYDGTVHSLNSTTQFMLPNLNSDVNQKYIHYIKY